MDLAADGVGDPFQRADAAVVIVPFVFSQCRRRIRGGEDGASLGKAALRVDQADDDMAYLKGVVRMLDQGLHVFPKLGAIGAGHVGEHIRHPLGRVGTLRHPAAAFQSCQEAVHVRLRAHGGEGKQQGQ